LWLNPPSIGCDEYHAGAVTGPLTAAIIQSFTSVSAGFPVQLTALIEGQTTASVWDFGDGVTATNEPYASHAWAAVGDYTVVLRAYNESQPAGISAMVAVHVVKAVHYVVAESANPVAPYTSWATAATSIQDAINAAVPGAQVLVTRGVYGPVYVYNSIAVRSINGPQVTAINGYGYSRCAYLGAGASLSGFTLTHGFSHDRGGGVYCQSPNAVVSNCVLVGNHAWNNYNPFLYYSYAAGGGAYGGTLNNCTLIDNSVFADSGDYYDYSYSYGGGAAYCTLNNCTLARNSALRANSYYSYGDTEGGGAYACTLNNCIVYLNTTPYGADYAYSTLNHCWTSDPRFVDLIGGNLRLQPNSPCINTGLNALAPAGPDLDGNPRIRGSTVDIGAYELQGTGLNGFTAWLWQYGLRTDGSADFADPDGDGMNNWQEWRCGTDPTDALSALRLLAPATDGTKLTVTWQSVAGVTYFLERATNLAASPAFTLLATNIPGQSDTTTYTDTNTIGAGPSFYRVGVRAP
jgi:hypothetical protein